MTENDEVTEDLRECKAQMAQLRARMETARLQMQQRDKVYNDIINTKMSKERKAELLELLSNSARVTRGLLTWESEVM